MDSIRFLSIAREFLRSLLATAITASLTAILLVLQANSSTAGLLYLALVVWCATLAGRAISVYLAILVSFLFDFFFLEPRYTLGLAGFQSWLAMIAFVFCCVVVGRVAERARQQTYQAECRREDVERLYALSQEMMLHEDAAGLVREIPRLVEQNFALDGVVLYIRDEDELFASIPSQHLEAELVSGSHPEEDGGPKDSLTELQNSLRGLSANQGPFAELPYGFTPMNLVFGMSCVGTLAWRPASLSREVATSVAAQVAIAITRAHAIEASARLEAVRAADRLRTALIDSLTHELRTPLTAIRAAATTLVDGYGLDDAARTELATIVDEESARLDGLIGEAMEMAEIDSNGIRVQLEPVYAGTFLEQAIEASHDQLATHRVTLKIHQPDTPVWLDPRLLGRVFRHLLENAARYTPRNSKILVSSRKLANQVEFVVEDDGPGIDAHDLPLIFERFYRGRRRSGTSKGSGMGLAITKAILTAHGGSIVVECGPVSGARFRFWVPLLERAPGRTGLAQS